MLAPHPLRLLVAVLTLASLCILWGCSRNKAKGRDTDPPPAAFAAPEVPARPQPEGPYLRLSGPELIEELRFSDAKATLVNAWASWCGPCRREFPLLVKLSGGLKARGIDVRFVSVEDAPAAVDFAKDQGLEPPIWTAKHPLGPFKAALNPKWPGMLPATFLFDNTGKLRYFWGGPVYEEDLMPIIDGFLRGEPIDGEAEFGLLPGKEFH